MNKVLDPRTVSGFVIYGISTVADPDTVRYIGQTTNFAARWKAHRTESRLPKVPVHYWIKKHGFDAVVFHIIKVCETREELDYAEVRAIAEYRTQVSHGTGGLNCTEGGQGFNAFGYHHSTETRNKISVQVRGEAAPNSVLKEEDVLSIREKYFSRASLQSDLAVEYGVSRSTIAGIIRRRKWNHLPASDTEKRFTGRRSEKAILSAEQVSYIRLRLQAGATQQSIANEVGVSRSCVQKISTGSSYQTYK